MGPAVSIVIDNYNYARYLRQSVESALRQTYPRTEVLIVDDASTDASREIIESFGSRVRPLLRRSNAGQAAAFNAGVQASSGEIVIFLDSDDYLYPGAVERVVAAQRPGISKVQYRLDLVDGGGRKIDVYPPPEVRFDSGDVVRKLLATGRYETTVTSGNAFSRAALEKILPIPEADFRLAADGYLVTVAPLFGPVVSLDEPLGAYRQHGDNAWSSTDDLAPRLRRALEHDETRYQALRQKAAGLGLQVAQSPGLRDYMHLTMRLASLCLDPAAHPYRRDARLALGLRGARAARAAALSPRRSAIIAAWFLAAGMLPRALARTAVIWRLAQPMRSPRVDRWLKVLRRFVR